MNIYSIVSMLFGSGVLVGVFKYLQTKLKENELKTEAVKKGVQALLRDRLIQTYNESKNIGYAPIHIKENFENMWNQYHNLGENGVMDGVHDEFMQLPTEGDK